MNFEEKDRSKQALIADAFIEMVNADHCDTIHMTRGNACLLRDEIARLRNNEAKK